MTADYHTDEEDARIYGTLYSMNQGQRVDRAITLEKVAEQRMPLKRLGTPDDIAAAALYLASDAGSWVTGQIITVAGGM